MIENDGQLKADVVLPDGTHIYWSTHCRHDRHDACAATEVAPGVARRPAQCKTCDSPCSCRCHRDLNDGGPVYAEDVFAREGWQP